MPMLRTLPAVALLWLTIAGLAAADAPTTRPDEQARAHPNTWIEFNPVFSGAPEDGRFIAVGWNKMVYDSKDKRAIVMDRWKDATRNETIYANALVAIDPSTAQARVLKLNNHRRDSQPGGGYRTVPLPANQAEPTPVDRHPYGCLAYSEHDHSIYLGPGANRTAKRHPGDFWRFDLAEGKWHEVTGDKGPAGGNLLERVMCYDRANKVIVFYKSAGKGSTWLFDVVKQQWRQPMPDNEPKAGMGAAMAYDAKRERVYLFAGPGADGKEWNTPGRELWSYSVAKNAWERLADAPQPARAPQLAYNSRHDVLLAIGPGKPSRVLVYHPDKNDWTELAQQPGAAWPTGAWDTLIYDPSRDLFVMESGVYGTLKWLVMHYQPKQKQQ